MPKVPQEIGSTQYAPDDAAKNAPQERKAKRVECMFIKVLQGKTGLRELVDER